ncbi:helix-turn-helix domain-containing protein [Serpentinicella alkaliphila]|nr:helix-turn-helix domain-containing protein [Serpentinicella alkaliphila]
MDFMTQVSYFMEFYTKQIEKTKSTSSPLLLKNHMIKRVIESKGQIKIKDLAYEIGYSERHTNLKFTEYFGMSPKLLSKIIRFQYVLNKLNKYIANPNQSSLILIAQEAGYYGQSHMYKDFSEFSSCSPGQYLDLLRQKNYYNRLVVVNSLVDK